MSKCYRKPQVSIVLLVCAALTNAASPTPGVLTIDFTKPLQTFNPNDALGAGIDGHEKGDIARLFTRSNIAAMRSAGLRPLTYRLRTELAGEAWHWNPRGTWSDASRQQGYWTSSAELGAPIEVSYGYRLPRRGNTIDQANDDGYSRIDDGDVGTFWKSNPFLEALPQWVIVDFSKPTAIDTVKIDWGIPFATEFHVQYGDDRKWIELPAGQVVQTAKLRVVMTKSSRTTPAGSTDPRDGVGYAIRELQAGTTDAAGHLHDAVRHAAQRKGQTVITVSSTDPWHRSMDRDDRTEQPGFDLTFRTGLTSGRPMLTPASILYDTPENAAAELRYLRARKYPVEEIELGEEPEEQQIAPEQYGALYRLWVQALRAVDPTVRIGGPSLVLLAPEAEPEPSWTKRWLADMREHGALDSIQFFTFEWYPYDDVCDPVADQLTEHAALMRRSMEQLVKDGVPRKIPWYITEYGYSAYATQAEVDLPGAILNAEAVAMFLSFGGSKAYLYGYEPNELLHEKPCTWGNNMLFLVGPPLQKTATYYGAKMLTQEWAQASGGPHTLYPAETGLANVAAFALKRPDGSTSILLLNKDSKTEAEFAIPLVGTIEVTQYSGAQYRWRAARTSGHATRNDPPAHFALRDQKVALPPYSITVVQGR